MKWQPAIFRSPLRLFGKGGRPEREKLILVYRSLSQIPLPRWLPVDPLGPFLGAPCLEPARPKQCSWRRFLLLCLSDTAATLSLSHLSVVFHADKEISSGCGAKWASCSLASFAKPPKFLLWTAMAVLRV